jgi:hypothetical protein
VCKSSSCVFDNCASRLGSAGDACDTTADCASQNCSSELQVCVYFGDDCLDDNCPDDPNKVEPGTCCCGVSEEDTDQDGTPDCVDDCPRDPLETNTAFCGCGVPGQVDEDSDQDGLADCIDACPRDSQKQQPGLCGCGERDDDSDGDGVMDYLEDCPLDKL